MTARSAALSFSIGDTQERGSRCTWRQVATGDGRRDTGIRRASAKQGGLG